MTGLTKLKIQQQMRAGLVVAMAAYLGALATFLLQVVLARTLNLNQFGAFAAALSLANLLTVVASLGLPILATRQLASSSDLELDWLPSAARLLLVGNVLVFAVMLAIQALLLDLSPLVTIALFAHLVGVIAVDMRIVPLQLQGKAPAIASLHVLPQILRLGIVIAVVALLGLSSTESAAVAVGLAGLITLGLVLWSARPWLRLSRFKPSPGWVNIRTLSKAVAPIAALVFLLHAQLMLMPALVGTVSTHDEAGVYAAAFTLVSATYLLPSVLIGKLWLADITRLVESGRDRFRRSYIRLAGFTVAAGLLATAAMLIVLPYLMVPLFGKEFGRSVIVGMVLAAGITLRFLASLHNAILLQASTLTAQNRALLIATAVATMVAVYAIGRYGALGAAMGAVAGDFILLMLNLMTIRRKFGGRSNPDIAGLVHPKR